MCDNNGITYRAEAHRVCFPRLFHVIQSWDIKETGYDSTRVVRNHDVISVLQFAGCLQRSSFSCTLLGRAGAKPHTTEFYAFRGILCIIGASAAKPHMDDTSGIFHILLYITRHMFNIKRGEPPLRCLPWPSCLEIVAQRTRNPKPLIA